MATPAVVRAPIGAYQGQATIVVPQVVGSHTLITANMPTSSPTNTLVLPARGRNVPTMNNPRIRPVVSPATERT